MGKYKENPKYNIVSLRVSDEDMENLLRLCKDTNRKISDLIREALQGMSPPGIGA